MKKKLAKALFYVSVNNRPRRILRFKETVKGDIYVRLYSGTQVGVPPNEIRILNDKYSVHPTLLNSELNMIKKTISLKNGFERTSVFFTNAIKSVGLCSNIFSCRMSNLQAQIYDLDQASLPGATSLGKLNVEEKVMILSLLVTNRSTEVPDFFKNADATQFTIGETKFVIIRQYQFGAALECAWTVGKFTFDPSQMEDEEAKKMAENRLKAGSLDAALEEIYIATEMLMENYFVTLHNLIEDEQIKQEIREMIDSKPNMAGMQFDVTSWEKKN